MSELELGGVGEKISGSDGDSRCADLGAGADCGVAAPVNSELSEASDNTCGTGLSHNEGAAAEALPGGGAAECEEYIPSSRFERTLLSVYRDEGLTSILKLLCYTAVIATVYALFYRIAVLFAEKKYIDLALLCACLAGSFLVVTLARRFIDAKRPYELFPFYKEAPKAKKGRSFPSRHTFSIFAIGTALCYFGAAVGIIILALGVLLAVCRVLLGYHFIRDTVAGAVIGTISGGLAILFLAIF